MTNTYRRKIIKKISIVIYKKQNVENLSICIIFVKISNLSYWYLISNIKLYQSQYQYVKKNWLKFDSKLQTKKKLVQIWLKIINDAKSWLKLDSRSLKSLLQSIFCFESKSQTNFLSTWYFCENFQYDEHQETKKRVDISRTLIDKKKFIFHEQMCEQKKFVFLIKNVSKKFNFTIRKQLKTTNNIISQFTTLIQINDHKITIMMNSNVLTNFMSINFVNKKNYLHDRKTIIIRLWQ